MRLKTRPSESPIDVKDKTRRSATSPAIKPYSMAVTPDSSVQKAATADRMGNTLVEDGRLDVERSRAARNAAAVDMPRTARVLALLASGRDLVAKEASDIVKELRETGAQSRGTSGHHQRDQGRDQPVLDGGDAVFVLPEFLHHANHG